MARKRPKIPAQTDGSSAEPKPQPLDPLMLLWSLTALTLAILLAYSHVYPQATYPARGIVPSAGLIVLSAAAVLIVLRAPWIRPRTVALVLLPCALFLWALWRTATALVPTEGTALLGTLLEGCLVFAVALVVAAVGKTVTSLDPWGTSEQETPKDAGLERTAPPGAERSRLFLDGLLLFFLMLALGMALWAIYQYFVQYDQQYVEFYESLRARGWTDADIPPREWDQLELLRAKRVGARFGNPNVLAALLSMVAPLALGAAWLWRDRSSRVAALAMLGMLWYVVILTGSRGGMLTLVVATGGAALTWPLRPWRKQGARISLAAAVCVAAVILALLSTKTVGHAPRAGSADAAPRPRYSFFQRVFGSPTVSQRLYYLKSAWPMVRQSPWLGHGLGAYAVLYPRYKQPLARETRYPHNLVVHLAVELGLVGLLLWTAWILVIAAVALGLLRRSREGPLAAGTKILLVAVAVFVFNNLFEMTWIFREAYLDWCLLLGCLAGLAAGPSPAAEPADQAGAGATRARAATIVITAVPLVLGVVFANRCLLCPLLAKQYQDVAKIELEALRKELPDTSLNHVLKPAHKMVRYQPDNPWYHHWLATFYREMGQIDLARAEYSKALELNPYSAFLHAELAKLEHKEGHPDAARRLLTKAVELYPSNDIYHYELAVLERDAGDFEAARRHIDDALERALDERVRPKYEQFRESLETTGTLKAGERP